MALLNKSKAEIATDGLLCRLIILQPSVPIFYILLAYKHINFNMTLSFMNMVYFYHTEVWYLFLFPPTPANPCIFLAPIFLSCRRGTTQ